MVYRTGRSHCNMKTVLQAKFLWSDLSSGTLECYQKLKVTLFNHIQSPENDVFCSCSDFKQY